MDWQDDILNLPYRPERIYDDHFWEKVKQSSGIKSVLLEDCLKIAISNQLTNGQKWLKVYKNHKGAPSRPDLFCCADFFDQVRAALNMPKPKFISKKECFRIAVKEKTFGRRAWRRIYKNYKNVPSAPSATYNDPDFFKNVKKCVGVKEVKKRDMTINQKRAAICKKFYNKARSHLMLKKGVQPVTNSEENS